MRLLKYIREAVYQGNIGFEELTKFYDIATEKQKQQMEEILNDGSWQKFRKLIKQVLDIELKERDMNTLEKLNVFLNEREAWEDSGLATSPNVPIGYVKAKKQPNGKYKLFFIGTENEVFPGEIFNSAAEARNFFKVQKIKAQKRS